MKLLVVALTCLFSITGLSSESLTKCATADEATENVINLTADYWSALEKYDRSNDPQDLKDAANLKSIIRSVIENYKKCESQE